MNEPISDGKSGQYFICNVLALFSFIALLVALWCLWSQEWWHLGVSLIAMFIFMAIGVWVATKEFA